MSGTKKDLTIGKLSERAGVRVETIRYYEREGLLPRAPRTEGGHRLFDTGWALLPVFVVY